MLMKFKLMDNKIRCAVCFFVLVISTLIFDIKMQAKERWLKKKKTNNEKIFRKLAMP